MEKKLHNYIEYIEKEAKHPTPELIKYHLVMTQQFQHERLIHLIVTMFLALFMIIFFITFLAFSISLTGNAAANYILGSVGGITVILLITTLFYVRHYYQLENGTQKLKEITKILYKR